MTRQKKEARYHKKQKTSRDEHTLSHQPGLKARYIGRNFRRLVGIHQKMILELKPYFVEDQAFKDWLHNSSG